MTDESPPSQQYRWKNANQIPHPLPEGTTFIYDKNNQYAIPNKVGQKIVITGHEMLSENDSAKYHEYALEYIYDLYPSNLSSEILRNKRVSKSDIEDWILQEKYPWYITELPNE